MILIPEHTRDGRRWTRLSDAHQHPPLPEAAARDHRHPTRAASSRWAGQPDVCGVGAGVGLTTDDGEANARPGAEPSLLGVVLHAVAFVVLIVLFMGAALVFG